MENERVRHPVRNDTGTGIVHAAPLLPLLLGNENPCPAKVWKDASGQLYVLMDRPRSNTSDGGQVPTISGLVENAEANTEAGKNTCRRRRGTRSLAGSIPAENDSAYYFPCPLNELCFPFCSFFRKSILKRNKIWKKEHATRRCSSNQQPGKISKKECPSRRKPNRMWSVTWKKERTTERCPNLKQ